MKTQQEIEKMKKDIKKEMDRHEGKLGVYPFDSPMWNLHYQLYDKNLAQYNILLEVLK